MFVPISLVLKHLDIEFETQNQFCKYVKKLYKNRVKPLIYRIFG